jgi:hypothetical protein
MGETSRSRHPDQYLIVRYEDLAAHPEEKMREICAFIDEPYAPEMLQMGGARRFRDQGSNSSYGAREAGVISTDSIGRFSQVLSTRQIAFIQTVAADRMRSLGYQVAPVPLSGRDAIRFRLKDLPLELARLAAWRARNSVRNRTGRPVPDYRLVPRHAAA